jgi:hypothetical protein
MFAKVFQPRRRRPGMPRYRRRPDPMPRIRYP